MKLRKLRQTTTSDLQFEFEVEERAAIREFDGGQSREDAERDARKEVTELRRTNENATT